jgi:hypothetical protein
MSVNANVRNVVIILAVAAVVAFVPGGGTASQVIIQAVAVIFLAALAWVGSILYRQNRTTLYGLGEPRRAGLYAAAAVLALTLTALHKLWGTAAGQVVWLILVGASVYVIFALLWAARRY